MKFFKRVGAYLIDVVIILFLSSMLSTALPSYSKIVEFNQGASDVLNEYFEVVMDGDSKKVDSYTQKINDYNYELNKLSISNNLISIGIYFLYFVVFQRYNSGQTIGKKMLKIEIVSCKDDNVDFKQLLIRGIILYPIVFDLLDVIFILIFDKSVYINLNSILSSVHSITFIVCLFTMIFGGRGLHDRLAGTDVVLVGSGVGDNDGMASKWKQTSEKEKSIKKYRMNHTSGKRKE